MQYDPLAELTGHICPSCGGALAKREVANGTPGDGNGQYQCHIGHTFTPAQLWIETCAMRNRALGAAARVVAETVDLARTLATEAREAGNAPLAARLEAEAQAEERYVGQLLEMLEVIGAGEPEADLESDR